MATIHMLLQGKGGVGKSLVAALLFQYLKTRDLPVKGFDTDPVNNTFAGYKEFDVLSLDIMNGDDIDQRRFDQLIENFTELPEDTHIVVDNGASCFVALCSYLKDNGALPFLAESGHEIYIHTLVTGGLALPDTLKGLHALTNHFPDVPIVVWLNPYYGDIILDGNDFFHFKVYAEKSESFKAVIVPEFGLGPTFAQSVIISDDIGRRGLNGVYRLMLTSCIAKISWLVIPWANCAKLSGRSRISISNSCCSRRRIIRSSVIDRSRAPSSFG